MAYKILFADDEFWIREKMKTIIDWKNYNFDFIEPATDGREVLEILESTVPDIIITDVDMPFMNGVELIEAIHRKHPDIITFVISGYDDFGYVKEALMNGAIDYLLKPIKKLDLIQVLTKALECISNRQMDERASLKAASVIQDREMSYYLNNGSQASAATRRKNILDISGHGIILIKVHRLHKLMKEYAYDINEVSLEIKGAIKKSLSVDSILLFNNIYRSNEFILLCHQVKSEQHKMAVAIMTTLSQLVPSPITILVEEVSYSSETLNEAYVQCVSKMMMRPFNERNTIIHESLDEQSDLMNNPFTDEYRQHLIRYMDMASYDKVNKLVFEEIGLKHAKEEGWQLIVLKQTIKRLHSALTEYLMAHKQFQLLTDMDAYAESVDKYIDHIEGDEFYNAVKEWLSTLYQEQPIEAGNSIKDVAKVVAEYIDEHYFEKFTLSEVAQKYNVESSYFSKIFREVNGENIISYIAGKRVTHALELMKEESHNLTEIAYMVGYDDYTYFNKVFKKVMGISPKSYRDSLKVGGDGV